MAPPQVAMATEIRRSRHGSGIPSQRPPTVIDPSRFRGAIDSESLTPILHDGKVSTNMCQFSKTSSWPLEYSIGSIPVK